MAKINHTSLAVSFSLGVTILIIMAGLFALLNSVTAGPQTETRAPVTVEGSAASGVAVGEAVSTEPTHVACNFNDWIGQSASAAEQAAKDTGRPYRMLPPGTAMTMDYRADRINIETDGSGAAAKVRHVTCG